VGAVHLRLLLYGCGNGTVEVAGLLKLFDRMRLELRSLFQRPQCGALKTQARSGILGKLHSQAVQELSIFGTSVKFAVLDDHACGAGNRGATLPAF
jgi:hypothetical protein